MKFNSRLREIRVFGVGNSTVPDIVTPAHGVVKASITNQGPQDTDLFYVNSTVATTGHISTGTPFMRFGLAFGSTGSSITPGTVNKVKFKLTSDGTATGTVVCRITSAANSGQPSASPTIFATSTNSVNLSTLNGTSIVEFDFDGTYTIGATDVAIEVYSTTAVGSTNNSIQFYTENGDINATHYYYLNSGPSAQTGSGSANIEIIHTVPGQGLIVQLKDSNNTVVGTVPFVKTSRIDLFLKSVRAAAKSIGAKFSNLP